jgi:hypothetical protein
MAFVYISILIHKNVMATTHFFECSFISFGFCIYLNKGLGANRALATYGQDFSWIRVQVTKSMGRFVYVCCLCISNFCETYNFVMCISYILPFLSIY